MPDKLNIVILGASGFVGAELIQFCLNHPNIEIQALSANSSAGQDIKIDQVKNIYKKYQFIDDINFDFTNFIFNCLPNNMMHSLMYQIPKHIRIIDLSADFRLDKKDDYKKWYKFNHNSYNECNNFTYGLSELKRKEISQSKHIANPGCYATSTLLPLIPLVKNELINDDIIIDSKSGYSGAGKTKKTEDLIKEVDENIKSYGVGDHSHISEINQEINKSRDEINIEIFFSANLIPVKSRILSNIYIKPIKDVKFDQIYNCLEESFKNEHFVTLLPKNTIPITKDVINTNKLILGLKKGYKDDTYCIVSVLDNLIKGAAGQAIQNFNIMNNFDEKLGIE